MVTRTAPLRASHDPARDAVSLRGQGTSSNGLQLSQGLSFDAWVGLGRQLAARRRRQLMPKEPSPVVLRFEVDLDRENLWRRAASESHLELVEWLGAVADEAARSTVAVR